MKMLEWGGHSKAVVLPPLTPVKKSQEVGNIEYWHHFAEGLGIGERVSSNLHGTCIWGLTVYEGMVSVSWGCGWVWVGGVLWSKKLSVPLYAMHCTMHVWLLSKNSQEPEKSCTKLPVPVYPRAAHAQQID